MRRALALAAALPLVGGCSLLLHADLGAVGGVGRHDPTEVEAADETSESSTAAETDETAEETPSRLFRAGGGWASVGYMVQILNQPIGLGLRYGGLAFGPGTREDGPHRGLTSADTYLEGRFGFARGKHATYLHGMSPLIGGSGFQGGLGVMRVPGKTLAGEHRWLPLVTTGEHLELFFGLADSGDHYVRFAGLRAGAYVSFGPCLYYFICFE